MTTIRQLITDSLRESGIIAADVEPLAEQAAEALRKINSFYRSLFGTELGEKLTNVNYGTNGLTNSYAIAEDKSSTVDSGYIPSNTRLVLNNNAAQTLYLSPNPQDGARVAIVDTGDNLATYNVVLNGNGRNIESAASVTLSTNGLAREWFYRADTGNWVKVTDLDYADESPLPVEFDDLISTAMAVRLNPRYAAETSMDTQAILSRIKHIFRARYAQTKEQDSEYALQLLPSARRFTFFGSTSTQDFDRGTL